MHSSAVFLYWGQVIVNRTMFDKTSNLTIISNSNLILANLFGPMPL